MKNSFLRIAAMTVALVLSMGFGKGECAAQETGSRHGDVYVVEYIIMPVMLKGYNEKEFALDALIDIEWVRDVYIDEAPGIYQILADTKAEYVDVDKKFSAIVYTFPEALEIPEAKYGAIMLPAKPGLKPRYFTLEKSFENYWVLGESFPDMHLNYGEVPEADSPKAFAKYLAKNYKKYNEKNVQGKTDRSSNQ